MKRDPFNLPENRPKTTVEAFQELDDAFRDIWLQIEPHFIRILDWMTRTLNRIDERWRR